VIVARPSLEALDEGFELSADVCFEQPTRKTLRIWYRFPDSIAPPPKPGDPFLAGLLIPAMSLGEDLEIDAPVSAELLEAARDRLAPILRCWGWEHAPVEIRCSAEPSPLPGSAARSSACFFSGGVDSWYSVLKKREELSHLIFVQGIDILERQQERWKLALDLTQGSADDLGLPLLVVRTNLHDVAYFEMPERLERLGRPVPYYSINRFYGSLQVSVALLLQSSLDEVVIPASVPYEDLEPLGSHWLLEPSWSSACQSYGLDGGEAGRLDKVRAITEWRPEALRRLRVCFASSRPELNCGTCEKCLRTLFEMHLCGAGGYADSFTEPLDFERVKDVHIQSFIRLFWLEMLEEARSQCDTRATEAVEVALAGRFNWRRLKRRIGWKPRLRQPRRLY
jgi:hypothetical protein